MDKLQELLEKFRYDTGWNAENRDGTHRFDKEIAWIEIMVKDYSEKLGLSVDKTVELMEEKRTYSWPNYYQPANFPPLDSKEVIGVFETFKAFKEHVIQNYKGFKCGACGNIGHHPQECDHRIKKDGICDWTSYGLFTSDIHAVIIESGIKPIPIFPPIPKDNVDKPQKVVIKKEEM